MYSHLTYDIVPGEQVVVHRPDVLIVEGLNVLQPPRVDAPRARPELAVSDYFDFSIYVDAKTEDVRAVVRRAVPARCGDRVRRPDVVLPPVRRAQRRRGRRATRARHLGRGSTSPTWCENIRPTRGRATLVLTKGPDHAVTRVRLRKL